VPGAPRPRFVGGVPPGCNKTTSMKQHALLPALALVIILPLLGGCVETGGEPMETVPYVDLDRFMGDWFVIASIPTFIEQDAYNAVESYERSADRQVATTFSFNKGSFDGPLTTYKPTGYVSDDPSNAIWGMQFIWPIRADYRVMYLSEDYARTVIGRNKRDYVWIMARTPVIAEADYRTLVDLIADQGYDISKIRRVPQRDLQAGDSRP
jgi:apolipoprotein D and lipocalin family protein